MYNCSLPWAPTRFSKTDCSLLIAVLVVFGTAMLLVICYVTILWLRRMNICDESSDAVKSKPDSADESPDVATDGSLTPNTERMLSIVEYMLESGDLEPVYYDTRRVDQSCDDKKSAAATPVKAFEVAADTISDTDRDEDEAASQLVVIDKTKLVPRTDVDNFIS